MTARSADDAALAGVLLVMVALFLLVGAPVSVLLGGSAVEAAVLALSGIGFAVLHLTVVVALHLRALRRGPAALNLGPRRGGRDL